MSYGFANRLVPAAFPLKFTAGFLPGKKRIENMKRLIILAVLLLSPMSAGAQELGGGYNQFIPDIYNGLVARSKVKWVRAFLNIPRNYLVFDPMCIDFGCVVNVLSSNISEPPDAVSTEDEMLAIAAASKIPELKSVSVDGQPIKIILSLKLDYKYQNMGVPSVDSPAGQYLMSAIEELLTNANLGSYIDILVVGNEPMFEVPISEAGRCPDGNYCKLLNALIDEVYGLKAANGWSYQIFTGALNHAYENGTTIPPNPILADIIDITKTNPKVSGIDLHEHVQSVAEADSDLNFIRNTEGITKEIISTEFSLVELWNSHANDHLGAWGARNGFSRDTLLYQWLNYLMVIAAQGHPIGKGKFMSYFAAQSWYPKGWFSAFFNVFQKYGVYAATYGLQVTPPVPLVPLTSDSQLWVLNWVYNGTLLGMGADGFYNINPLVYADFRNVIKAQMKP